MDFSQAKQKLTLMLERLKRGQKGLGLIEVILAVALTAIIGGAVTMATSQIITGTERSSDYMTAVHQVQNAGCLLNRDAQEADKDSITVDTDPDTDNFLIMSWFNWNTGEFHKITYTLEDDGSLPEGLKKLVRTHKITFGGSQETVTPVAKYIVNTDPDDKETWCEYDDGVLTVKITAICGDATKTREYQIKPRSTGLSSSGWL